MFSKLFSLLHSNDAQMLGSELKSFLLYHEAQGSAAKTITWYGGQIRIYLDWLRARRMRWDESVQPESIEAYLSDRRKRVSPSTVDADFRALRSFFNWMDGRQKLNGHPNPFALVHRPRTPRRQPRRATLREYERLISAIPAGLWSDLRDRALIQMMFVCGLRVGELVGLRVEDVDLETKLLTVIGKGDRQRVVPFVDDLKHAIIAYLMSRPAYDGPALWLSSDGSASGIRGQLSISGVQQILRRRCAAAGIRHLNPHSLRHGFATEMLNHGAEMSGISRLMGHSSLATTSRFYAEWETSGIQRAYDAVWARIKKGHSD